jgi:hypothetical protein
VSVLIDGNVLISIAVDDHEHHAVAGRWFAAQTRPLATCAITQGTVVRHIVRNGRSMASALAFLAAFASGANHEFWADDLPFDQVPTPGVIGHRQVTDAYLAELARRHRAKLATFDRGLAALHADVAELIPVAS